MESISNEDIVRELARKYIPDCPVRFIILAKRFTEFDALTVINNVEGIEFENQVYHKMIFVNPKRLIDSLNSKITILHEVAHVLTNAMKHNTEWKNKFMDLLLENNIPISTIRSEMNRLHKDVPLSTV